MIVYTVWVNDTSYYGSWGGGLEGGALLASGLRNDTVLLFRRQDNQDTSYLPANSQYRGTSLSAVSRSTHASSSPRTTCQPTGQ